MSSSRLRLILVCALVGACLGTASQILLINGRMKEFRSLAKLVVGGQMLMQQDDETERFLQDFYGTIIETIESAEMKRRALERVRALNPDLKDKECDVAIRVARTKGSAIFNILATGSDPKYTRIFLDAVLDEFISFRQSIREQARGKVLEQFLQEVVTRQKKMEDSMAALEKIRVRVDNLSTKSDQERIVMRLNTLRNQRDDLRLELKPVDTKDAARQPLEAKLGAAEQEIQSIEIELKRHEPDLSELRTLTEKSAMDKLAYEKLFELVCEKLPGIFDCRADYIAIQERASPSSENVEDWVLPIAVGAGGGGFLGALLGLFLSFLILQAPKPPQMPTAI